jgi:oligopeptide transport system substrate-binding protein
MVRLLLIPAVLLALLSGVMYWSKAPAEEKADFTYINLGEVRTADPNHMSYNVDIRIGYALWEGLYALDPVTLNAIPGSAYPIEISDDKIVYTFHIRPEAKWSNGDDLVARDFIFGWKRMLETPGDYSYLLFYIKGAQEYSQTYDKDFKHADFSTVGIEQLTPKTLRVTLKQYVGPFPDICAMPAFFPQHEKSMAKFLDQAVLRETGGKLRYYDETFTRPPNLVTNGPYVLTNWEFKQRMRMTANPFYWDRAHVKSKIIDQVSANDLQWAYARYLDGGADWIPEFTGDIGKELFAQKLPQLHVFTGFGTYFFSFNCQPNLNDGRPNPLADVRVRQAFSRAVDKQVIVNTITRMGEIPCTTFVPVGAFTGYHSPAGLSRDIPAARKLLAEAGYPDGKGFPEIAIMFNTEFPAHASIAENISRQWLENLGVRVKLEGLELSHFSQRQLSKEYEICRSGWFGDYNDLSTFTDTYKPDSENNFSGWKDQQYVDLCNKADVERDPKLRLKYFEAAETRLLDQAPILPMYTYTNQYLIRDNVRGIPLNPRSMLVLKSVEVKR